MLSGTDIAAVRTAPIRTAEPPAEQRGKRRIADGRPSGGGGAPAPSAFRNHLAAEAGEGGPAKPGRGGESAKTDMRVRS